MWLSRNTKVLDSFSPQKWEVNTYSTWSCYWHSAFLVRQAQMASHHSRQKNYGSHAMARVHNMWTAAHALISSRNRLLIIQVYTSQISPGFLVHFLCKLLVRQCQIDFLLALHGKRYGWYVLRNCYPRTSSKHKN